jgi:hypothetical protein
MNVVMPTAMMSMHTDADLAANAAKTAKRAKIVLQQLSDSGLVEENSQGILAAVTDDDKNDSDNAKVLFQFNEYRISTQFLKSSLIFSSSFYHC